MITILHKTTKQLAKYETYYDILMMGLSLGIVVDLILEVQVKLSDAEIILANDFDRVVWGVFVLDYAVRFLLAENRRYFIKHNIIDLIAIIPANMLFQGLRTLRLVRVIYMFRCLAYASRAYKRVGLVLKTNDFDHILWITFSIIFMGAILISFVDDLDFGDALWWSFVTTTTVGYGDIAPQSFGGRIIAVGLMLVGIGFLSTLTGTISTFFIKNTGKSTYKDEELEHIIVRLHNFKDLSVEDLNAMHKVLLVLKEKDDLNKEKSLAEMNEIKQLV
jgi:voltage-gated potassium channel